MELPANVFIIVGIIIVVLGIFAGMLLSTLKEDGEPEEAVDQAPPGGRQGRYTPLVRFWRERGTGALVVEMDGKSFLSPEPMSADQRERLERAAREMRTWLGMGLLAAQPDETLSTSPDAQTPTAANHSAVAPPNALSAPAEPYASPPPARPAAYPAVPVNLDPPAVVSSNKSIVMQIEDILQDMISGTPLDRRGLHLVEDPVRGVMVQLGASLYEGIDSVPEPDVKATIRAAVDAWENAQ